MDCLFCKIVNGEMDSYIVYQDDKCVVTLDINPHDKGHILIIPKEHVKIFFTMNPDLMSHLLKVTYLFSKDIEKEFKTKTTINIPNGGAAGQRIEHASIQVIPGDVLNLKKSKKNNKETFKKLKEIIKSSFE
ncbi:MAG: HIT family protein [Candidatus Woesearchaeota archaeon]